MLCVSVTAACFACPQRILIVISIYQLAEPRCAGPTKSTYVQCICFPHDPRCPFTLAKYHRMDEATNHPLERSRTNEHARIVQRERKSAVVVACVPRWFSVFHVLYIAVCYRIVFVVASMVCLVFGGWVWRRVFFHDDTHSGTLTHELQGTCA